MTRFALKNLFSRPIRSLLALCGLTVAIAGMVGLFSVAEGIEDSVNATFGKLPGLSVMQPGAPIPLFSRIPASWGDEIRRLPGVHVVHSEVWARAQKVEGKAAISPPRFLFGSDLVEADRLKYSVYREGLTEGRALRPDDRGTLNVMISRAIADEHHKTLGEPLRVDGREFTIVGIYEAKSLFLDVAIILDIDQVRRMGRIGTETVSNFYVEPDAGVDRKKLVAEIKALFRGRAPDAWQPSLNAVAELTGEKPGSNPLATIWQAVGNAFRPQAGRKETEANAESPDTSSPNDKKAPRDDEKSNSPGIEAAPEDPDELPVEVRDSDDWAGEFERFSADLDLFLLLMTGIGVTIAFVGIVNTMLMSVTERIIEFGILKANGWSNGEVLRLIAIESALLGFAGGVTGSIVGWVATLAINARWPTRIHLYASPQLLAFSLVFSIVLGVLGGLYPAWRASRMLPMEAIRRG
jgi:putative ABC transport system permease protein